MEIKIKDLEHISEAAREFVNYIGDRRVFAFYGSMGAGKTTFVKAVCEVLGVEDVITSPTFAIVNEYTIGQQPTAIYHFDFYRIKKLEEVYDMGYEDYFLDVLRVELPDLVALGLFGNGIGHLLKVDVYLVGCRLKDAAVVVVVDDSIQKIIDVVFAEGLLQVQWQPFADKGYLAAVLGFVHAELIFKTWHNFL